MIRVAQAITAPFAPALRLRARLASWQSRQALSALDDRALNDIGLSRDTAEREARRPLWDAPDHWAR